MKFLFLNQTFYPDVASSGQHLSDVAVELIERGHAVTVVTSRRAYDDPRRIFAREEIWRGVRILRVSSTGFGKASRWRRALDFSSFTAMTCLRALFLDAHDVVVSLTSPPLISLVGAWLARRHQSRFVYWVMDLNPDEAVAAKWLRAESVIGKLLEWASRLSLRSADRVIALDRFMAQRIVGKGIPATRISVLPPWSHDPEVRFDAPGRQSFRQQYGLTGKFVVMYSGNHSPCHPLDTVLGAVQKLAEDRQIIFCFIGGGTEFRRIQDLVHPAKLQPGAISGGRLPSNVLCLPYRPLDQLSASLSAADLHLVIQGDDFVGLVHPCKIYNILRVGAPLVYIGPQPSPISEILSKGDGGLLASSIRHGDVEGLVRGIERLRRSTSHVARPTYPGSSEFSRKTILPRLLAQLGAAGRKHSAAAGTPLLSGRTC